jgi:hypothetical protein
MPRDNSGFIFSSLVMCSCVYASYFFWKRFNDDIKEKQKNYSSLISNLICAILFTLFSMLFIVILIADLSNFYTLK